MKIVMHAHIWNTILSTGNKLQVEILPNMNIYVYRREYKQTLVELASLDGIIGPSSLFSSLFSQWSTNCTKKSTILPADSL